METKSNNEQEKYFKINYSFYSCVAHTYLAYVCFIYSSWLRIQNYFVDRVWLAC